MKMSIRAWKNCALAAALAGACALGNGYSAVAAPVLSNTAAIKQALPSAVTDVRYHRGGGAFFGGFVIGSILGAAIARPYYYGYPGYGYAYYPAYSYGPYYPYADVYPVYGPSYGYVGSGYVYRHGGHGVRHLYVGHRGYGHLRHR
jgi:hypothetical protein